jgi:hypothetical protein
MYVKMTDGKIKNAKMVCIGPEVSWEHKIVLVCSMDCEGIMDKSKPFIIIADYDWTGSSNEGIKIYYEDSQLEKGKCNNA